ncbi:MAG TPA: AmmeMemoRadiSam system protein B [Nitrospirota bacterium]|nr:AmmeMemoRadiSam system protein B [Nitrospirota bacterium]
MNRTPVARNFYSGDVRAQMEAFRKAFLPPEGLPERIVSGVVPHAGWFFSGATASKVYLSIKEKESPRTFVLFGAVHVHGVRSNSVYPAGTWETPLGPVEVDSELSRLLTAELDELLEDNAGAHVYEHSIEVQLPMIKHLFPDAKVVPIAVPPSGDAASLGEAVGNILSARAGEIVCIGSTDLTHYGASYGYAPAGYGRKALDWMRSNDGRIIRLALSMKADEIVPEAARSMNACGPGAMAAAVAAAKAMGASEGLLLEHTTSHDVYPEDEFEMAVGYAGIIF